MKGEYYICLHEPKERVGLLLDAHKTSTVIRYKKYLFNREIDPHSILLSKPNSVASARMLLPSSTATEI